MRVTAAVAEKITVTLAGRGIIPEDDAGLYRYGIENGMAVVGNILASLLFGLVTGRLGNILFFLFFYGSLRSFSGGIHCKSRTGCFTASILILFIPAYLCDWAAGLPLVAVIIGGLTAMAVILALSPVESVNKPLSDEDFWLLQADEPLHCRMAVLHPCNTVLSGQAGLFLCGIRQPHTGGSFPDCGEDLRKVPYLTNFHSRHWRQY